MNRAWTLVFAAAASWAAVAMITAPVWAVEPLGYQLFCLQHPVECERDGASMVSFDEVADLLHLTNVRVNTAITPKADRVDTWELSPYAGDCEDYAITKRSLLRKAGVPTNAMRIGIFRLPNGENHAVLVVSTDLGDVVLDNLKRELYLAPQSIRLI